MDIYLDPDDPQFHIYMAGFKAALAANLYDTKISCSSTCDSYSAQGSWILKQKKETRLDKDVTRGVTKQLQDNRKFTQSIDINFFGYLYSKYAKCISVTTW